MPANDVNARIAELEAERDAALQLAEGAQNELAQARAQGSTRRGDEEKEVKSATRNKPLWPFNVRSLSLPKLDANSPRHPELPVVRIDAVDESEAIRQYCLMHKDEQGRQLDPTRYTFRAECLKEREREQQRINKVNNRRLVADGKLPVLTRAQELRPPEVNKADKQLIGAA